MVKDSPETGGKAGVRDAHLSPPPRSPHLPAVTGEKWPMARSERDPVGKGGWNVVFVRAGQAPAPSAL